MYRERLKKQADQASADRQFPNRWRGAVLPVLMILIGLSVGYIARPYIEDRIQGDNVTEVTSSADMEAIAAELQSRTRHYLGSEDAPVTLIEFGDFHWGYCGQFATGAGRQIIEEYVKTGKVRLGYFHFAFLGAESVRAAEASECAADQNMFWEYHDVLFVGSDEDNRGDFSDENLVYMAGVLGMDTAVFEQCLLSDKYAEEVQSQISFSQSIGVRSTPSFLLNAKPVIGALPFESFQEYIEAELNGQ